MKRNLIKAAKVAVLTPLREHNKKCLSGYFDECKNARL